MVLTAFRGADTMVPASVATVPQSGESSQVQHEALARDLLMVGAPALFEANPTDAPAFEPELQSPILFAAPDRVTFDFYKDENPDDRIHMIEADSSAFSGNASSQQCEELSDGFEQSISTTDHDYAKADDSPLTGQPSAITESAVDSTHTGANSVEDRSEDPPSIGEEAVADSWEAPLPAWDYSHSEWPLLVGPTKRRSFRKLRAAIAALVLLTCAAGFYFLIYRPSTPAHRTSTDSGTTTRVSAVEPRAADSDALTHATPTPSGAPAGGSLQPAETVAPEAVAPNDNSSQGRFSLQAAAFPTQDGADEFAEKLKRAGVPSYVVAADLARRGRWFRVRVGRFNSAEDAQRFTGEAQQRARAGGLAVQLIVCQYDQP
jgi:cell division septation protein DedD